MRRSEPQQPAAFDADNAEAHAVRGGIAAVASGVQGELITGEALDVADDAGIPMPAWQKEQFGAEALAGAAVEVATVRSNILGNKYPFKIDRGALRYVHSDNGFYEYCLATSLAASDPARLPQKLVRHFERVVRDLLVAFVGGDAVGVRFGWPTEKDFDRIPHGIDRKIKWMKKACRFDDDEWTLDPCEKLDALRKRAKDARIDVIVHRSHADGRPGGLTILGQCGCGRNDVDSSSRKHSELSDSWLKHFFGRASVPRPMRVFATSQHMVRTDDLYLKQSEADAMVFDRIRLTLLAGQSPTVVEAHRETIEELTEAFFK